MQTFSGIPIWELTSETCYCASQDISSSLDSSRCFWGLLNEIVLFYICFIFVLVPVSKGCILLPPYIVPTWYLKSAIWSVIPAVLSPDVQFNDTFHLIFTLVFFFHEHSCWGLWMSKTGHHWPLYIVVSSLLPPLYCIKVALVFSLSFYCNSTWLTRGIISTQSQSFHSFFYKRSYNETNGK